MTETIEIVIRPSLEDIDGVEGLIELVGKLFGGEGIEVDLDIALEKVAEAVLDRARHNVLTGYRDLGWQPRDKMTEKLYKASPLHEDYSKTGMDTGRHKLVNSLERGGDDNIWTEEGEGITVGTGFKHAKILEEGGKRETTPDWPSLGFKFDDTGNLVAVAWLKKAIKEGKISQAEVNAIAASLMTQDHYIPARPFMSTAVRHIKDTRKHSRTFALMLARELAINSNDYRLKITTTAIRSEEDV